MLPNILSGFEKSGLEGVENRSTSPPPTQKGGQPHVFFGGGGLKNCCDSPAQGTCEECSNGKKLQDTRSRENNKCLHIGHSLEGNLTYHNHLQVLLFEPMYAPCPLLFATLIADRAAFPWLRGNCFLDRHRSWPVSHTACECEGMVKESSG